METIIPFSSMLLIVSSLSSVLIYFAAKIYYSLWWKPKRLEKQLRQQGISGNSYRILYGDMKDEMQAYMDAWAHPMDQLTHRFVPRVIPFVHQLVQNYGKMCFQWVGTTPRVVIWETEMVKEVLSDKSWQIMKPPPNPLVLLLATGLANLEGEEWAKRRKIITPAFHHDKLKAMVGAFLTSCMDMVRRWDELVGNEGCCELDVWPEFQNLTKDVISRTAFGSSFEEGKRIFQLQKEQVELVLEAARVPYIPGYQFIPTAKNKRRKWLDKEIKSMLAAIIDRKLKSTGSRVSDTNDDLLGLLLQFTVANHTNYRLTIDEVIEECKLFYFSGQETTSTLLTWTLVLLSMHPDWQQRAREEVLNTCGKNNPDFNSINRLKIVTMILNEVLRLYPSVVAQYRHTYKETKLGEFSLPAGVGIMLATMLIHHDTQIWGDDAEEFKPERFSEGISKACKEGQNAFFPFGWGPRICIGQNFAMIEAKMALATILQCFSFELSPSYTHAPYTVITLQPQHGAHIILHRL